MMNQNSLQTIDNILFNDLGEDVDYSNVLKVIYCHYLNDTERTIYNAALLYFSGKTQKDIGILLNMEQPYFNKRLYKLINKMKNISAILYDDRETLIALLNRLKKCLLPDQYKCIALLLGGNNNKSDIARYLHCTSPYITKIKNNIFKRLSKEDRLAVKFYLDVFKKPYLVK